MADCCSQVKAELAALRAEVAKLQKVDEENIIRKSVARSEASIVPKIDSIAGAIAATVFNTKINPFSSRLAKNEQLTGDALATARQGLEKAFQAGDAARTAQNTANGAANTAGSALAKIASALAAIAALALIVGTFVTLRARIDALERAIDSLQNGVSKAISIAGQALGVGREAKTTANKALDRATTADSTANRAFSKATNAEQVANDARAKATNAQNTANTAKNTADTAKATADTAKKTADDTRAFVQPLPAKIDDAKRKADEAKKQADEADKKASEALRAIPQVRDIANSAKNLAQQALDKALEALRQIKLVPAGKPGINGKNGINGKDGKQGLQGIPGRDGLPGKPGKDGKDGRNGLSGLTGRPGKDGKDGKDGEVDNATKALIRDIASKAAFIPALVARPAPLSLNQTINAAATGTCRTTQPGGCSHKANQDLANNINNATNQAKNDLLNKLNAGANASQLALLNTINTKLGSQVLGGLSGNLGRITRFIRGERITNMITMAATLHNAALLSNALTTTLLSTVTNVFAIIGLKDADGQAYDASELIKSSLANFLRSAIGVQNYNQLTLSWKKANRVYQAGANVVSRVRSIVDSVGNIATVTNINVADIGNALRKDGAVKEDSYKPMSRTVGASKFQRAVDKLTNLTEAASDIESISSSVRSVQDDLKEIRGEQAEFKKAVSEGIKTQEKLETKSDRETNPPNILEKDLVRG